MTYLKDAECKLILIVGMSAFIWLFSMLSTATAIINHINTDTTYSNKEHN